MAITNRIHELMSMSSRLSNMTGKCQLHFVTDFLYCFIKYGCLPRQYEYGGFYKKRDFERKNIMTYRRACEIYRTFNDNNYIHYLQEKSHFNKYFSNYIHRDWLYVNESTFEEFAAFMAKFSVVMVKPIKGENGTGVRKVRTTTDESQLKKLYHEFIDEDVMIEEVIIQHHKMVFGNKSVNTIRIFTVLDRKGETHVMKCILRAGVGNSDVDNYCSGGVVYDVNVEHGIVDSFGMSRNGDKPFYHPQTDIIMLGYQIPNWDKVIECVRTAHQHLPQCRAIGWDVAISEDSVQLIEGNHNWGYELTEFLGPSGIYPKYIALK